MSVQKLTSMPLMSKLLGPQMSTFNEVNGQIFGDTPKKPQKKLEQELFKSGNKSELSKAADYKSLLLDTNSFSLALQRAVLIKQLETETRLASQNLHYLKLDQQSALRDCKIEAEKRKALGKTGK